MKLAGGTGPRLLEGAGRSFWCMSPPGPGWVGLAGTPWCHHWPPWPLRHELDYEGDDDDDVNWLAYRPGHRHALDAAACDRALAAACTTPFGYTPYTAALEVAYLPADHAGWLHTRLFAAVCAAVPHRTLQPPVSPVLAWRYSAGAACLRHDDRFDGKYPHTAAAAVVQLSDPGAYSGGILDIEGDPAPTERGTVIVIASDARHAVSTIETGTRHSLTLFVDAASSAPATPPAPPPRPGGFRLGT